MQLLLRRLFQAGVVLVFSLSVLICAVQGQEKSLEWIVEELFSRNRDRMEHEEIFKHLQRANQLMDEIPQDPAAKNERNLIKELVELTGAKESRCYNGELMDKYYNLMNILAEDFIKMWSEFPGKTNAYFYLDQEREQQYKLCSDKLISLANKEIPYRGEADSLRALMKMIDWRLDTSNSDNEFQAILKGSVDFLEDLMVQVSRNRATVTSYMWRSKFNVMFEGKLMNLCQRVSKRIGSLKRRFDFNGKVGIAVKSDIRYWFNVARVCDEITEYPRLFQSLAYDEHLSRCLS